MKKKLFAFFLALALVFPLFSLMTVSARAAGLPFTDVPDNAWYYADVKNSYDLGLIDGLTDTGFGPGIGLTYAEAIKLACCMNAVYNGDDPAVLFTGSSPWYQQYIDYAKAHGIPWSCRNYNAYIKRSEYVYIFYYALPATDYTRRNNLADGVIPDVPMSHQYSKQIYAFYRAGILEGNDENGTFAPDSGIKRREVAAILSRMMDSSRRKTGLWFAAGWKAAYRNMLDGAVYRYFCLYDIDKDGIPELIIRDDESEIGSTVYIYTYGRSGAVQVGKFPGYHCKFASYPGGNGLINHVMTQGHADMAKCTLVSGKLNMEGVFFTETIIDNPNAKNTLPGAIVPGAVYLTEYTTLSVLS